MRIFMLLASAAGAALMYFFDPDNGRRRRAAGRGRTVVFFRRSSAQRLAHKVQSEGGAAIEKVRRKTSGMPDNELLAQQVESEIFRNREVPKDRITVEAEDGVVYLRGEVPRPELIEALEQSTRRVTGVRRVENLLQATETPVPTQR